MFKVIFKSMVVSIWKPSLTDILPSLLINSCRLRRHTKRRCLTIFLERMSKGHQMNTGTLSKAVCSFSLCVCVCMRACVRAHMCVCVQLLLGFYTQLTSLWSNLQKLKVHFVDSPKPKLLLYLTCHQHQCNKWYLLFLVLVEVRLMK